MLLNILLILFIVTNIAALCMLAVYHLHMFQLNSYKHREEKMWMKKNGYPLFGRVFGLAVSLLGILLHIYTGLVFAILLNIATAYGNRPKAAKVKFNVTFRVKRMMATMAGIYILCYTLTVVFLPVKAAAIMIQMLSMAVPFVMLAADTINRPLEKLIGKGFINEAKHMIEDMPYLTVVGVTGSYGKTSMKYILNTLLSAKYNVLITPGNFNTTFGVVRTIREHLKPSHQVFICEMGAKNVGDIKEICDIVHPKYGVITSVGPQHLESFQTVDNVIKTKFELADAVPDDGKVFLNYDNEYIRGKQCDKTIISYGVENKDTDYTPYDITVNTKGSVFKMKIEGREYEFTTSLIGSHNVLNVAGAVAVACELGVSPEDICYQVKKLKAVPHRLQLLKTGRGMIIDDAYNSNPAGAKAAVETLKMFDATRILVTPGMIELGSRQEELNEEFGRQAAACADYIVLVGKKQTEPIYRGVMDAGYEPSKLMVADSLNEAMSFVDAIKAEKEKVILLENDLPDNY